MKFVNFFQKQKPDIICLQEASRNKLNHLSYLLSSEEGKFNIEKASNCAILSKFALKVFASGGMSGVRFLTVQVLMGEEIEPIFVTSLHFSEYN